MTTAARVKVSRLVAGSECIHQFPPGHKPVQFIHGRNGALYALVLILNANEEYDASDGYYLNVKTKEVKALHYAGHA